MEMNEKEATKHSNAIKALAKELEGRGQMHGIVLEIIVG